jgi:DNA-binding FrmR family transcriptional regulator
MIELGQPCVDIASQMAAARRALDSTFVRLTLGYVEQELHARLTPVARDNGLEGLMNEVRALLDKVR